MTGRPCPVTVDLPVNYDVSALPDYVPAFAPGWRKMMADADNNVWIRFTGVGRSDEAEIYDVVNRRGQLSDRVRLPPGRELIGLGPGGVVYMIGHDGGMQLIEAARVR